MDKRIILILLGISAISLFLATKVTYSMDKFSLRVHGVRMDAAIVLDRNTELVGLRDSQPIFKEQQKVVTTLISLALFNQSVLASLTKESELSSVRELVILESCISQAYGEKGKKAIEIVRSAVVDTERRHQVMSHARSLAKPVTISLEDCAQIFESLKL